MKSRLIIAVYAGSILVGALAGLVIEDILHFSRIKRK